jgi:hypothetical protein
MNPSRAGRGGCRRSGVVHYAAVFFLAIFAALGYGFYHYVVVPEQSSRLQQPADTTDVFSRYRLVHGAVTSTAGTAIFDNTSYIRDASAAAKQTQTSAAAAERKTEVIVADEPRESKIFIRYTPSAKGSASK